MSQRNETTPNTADGEIVSRRVINTPQDKIFEAFRNPGLLAQWWGPEGFTNTFHTFDFRPDGVWEFIMHGPTAPITPIKAFSLKLQNPSGLFLITSFHRSSG